MADTTPVYGFPFLELGDPPDLAAGTKNLAQAVETKIISMDSAVSAINGLAPAVASSTVTVSTNSTTFVAGTTPFGIVFVAPPSGIVAITMSAYFTQTQDGGVGLVSHTVRTGGTIGSGTVIGTAANSNRALVAGGVVTSGKPIYFQASRRTIWTGLTNGATYNARVEMAVDLGGGLNVFYRELQVEPSL
ncbi:MAG TPA: hypothetical protein VIQ30_14070 [Pseudonocardia sp.]